MTNNRPFVFPNKSTLIDWFSTLEPHEPVAKQAAAGIKVACPMRRYFFTHGKDISVGTSTSIDRLTDKSRTNPAYIRNFIENVDRYSIGGNVVDHETITPAMCLDVLGVE